ncbi:MAG TPA: septation protein IspZ [Caulobacteraceae bacterium]|jgi:intracellular septation protein A
MTAATETYPNPAIAAEPEGSKIHPIVHAGKWLAADMLSTLFFVGVYAATHSIYVATGLGIAVGVAQIAYLKARRARIDTMQWMSLGLVVVFGSASLLTHDPRFVMLKPTLIYAALGAVMMKRGWMARYVPPVALPWSGDVVNAFGYVWAGLMFLTGALNLALVAHGDPKLWAWFIGVVPLASKLVLFSVQYVSTRMIVLARHRAAALAS